MDRIVAHWVERAEYDLGTAKAMLETARYGNYKESLSEIINEEQAKEVYVKTEEIFQWLYRKID